MVAGDGGPQFRFRGAIVRIRLQNFMTYRDCEIKPGPNLNMILGPNGTGKSAIVCCIIVGLAGEVSLTGRGASPSDFVKKGTNSCSTEIELYNDRGQNYIIQRTITITNRSEVKIDHKSEWKINGKGVNKSEVQALTKKLSIKVDNLCQFLPQDSVTQFVKMSPSELLLNTLKAAGDNQLVDDLQKLIEYSKDIDTKLSNLNVLERACQENEVNAQRLEAEVHQLRQREALVKERNLCAQKIYYVRFVEAQNNLTQHEIDYQRIKTELQNLEASTEPYRKTLELARKEEERYREALKKSSDATRRYYTLIMNAQQDIESRKVDCQEVFANFKGKVEYENRREACIGLLQQELSAFECKLREMRDIDCSRQISAQNEQLNKVSNEITTCGREKSRLTSQMQNMAEKLDRMKRDMDQIQAVRDRKILLLREKFRNAYVVVEWLAKNQRLFEKKVFIPIMCEINIKIPRYARIVEHALPRNEYSAFVCESSEDLKTFTRTVRDTLKVKFNVILAPDKSVAQFEEDARQLPHDFTKMPGFRGFVKDLVDAPELIMRYLCGSGNFHRVPVFDECPESQLNWLLENVPKFYVGNEIFTSQKSRYDQNKVTSKDVVREAQLLVNSLDQNRYKELSSAYETQAKEREELLRERERILSQHDSLRQQWQQLSDSIKDLRSKQEAKSRIELDIKRVQADLRRKREEKVDIEAERVKLRESIDKINNKIVAGLDRLTGIYEEMVEEKNSHREDLLMLEIAKINLKVADKRYEDAQNNSKILKEELRRKQNERKELQASVKASCERAEEKIAGFEDGRLTRAVQRKFDAIEENTVDALKNKRDELEIRIQRIYKDQNNCILAEFNRQNEELKDRRARIAELDANIKEIATTRDAIKQDWLPKLNNLIEVIDTNYKQFMRRLCYDGHVKLDYDASKADNFASYGIGIMVKYRDNEDLISLSATRQSGGERSVATMIYMLALQTITSVPFRCVDEINQGMDKENERKVFELLVQTADSSSSQYFLVSPKLLSNLPYSEKMKIHIVFSGRKMKLAWNDQLC